MTKNHATNPRAVREARHRQARMARAEQQDQQRHRGVAPVVVGWCLHCHTELRPDDQFDRLNPADPGEPALVCQACTELEPS
jgi:hypothetical protein